jgi:hypothetical protein
MTEKLKVSIQLNLEIPVKYDAAGHRVSPTSLVAPYVDRLMNDMRYEGLVPFDYDVEDWGEDYYQKLETMHFGKNTEEKAKLWKESDAEMKKAMDLQLHKMWIDGQERVCQQQYGISWSDFRALNSDQRGELLATKGGDPNIHKSLECESPYGTLSQPASPSNG